MVLYNALFFFFYSSTWDTHHGSFTFWVCYVWIIFAAIYHHIYTVSNRLLRELSDGPCLGSTLKLDCLAEYKHAVCQSVANFTKCLLAWDTNRKYALVCQILIFFPPKQMFFIYKNMALVGVRRCWQAISDPNWPWADESNAGRTLEAFPVFFPPHDTMTSLWEAPAGFSWFTLSRNIHNEQSDAQIFKSHCKYFYVRLN